MRNTISIMRYTPVCKRYVLLLTVCMLAVLNVHGQSDRQFIRNGNRLYRQQNYAKAEIEYRKALGKNPSNAQALYNPRLCVVDAAERQRRCEAVSECGQV